MSLAAHRFEYQMNFCYFLQAGAMKNGILFQNCSDLHTVRKICSSDREKLLKFEAEGREFAKSLRSLEQFIQAVKVQNNFW